MSRSVPPADANASSISDLDRSDDDAVGGVGISQAWRHGSGTVDLAREEVLVSYSKMRKKRVIGRGDRPPRW